MVADELPDYWHTAGRWWGIHNKNKLPYAEKKVFYMSSKVSSLFLDFLSSRLLESKKRSFIRKNQTDPDVFLRVEKEVTLDKYHHPTSTYTDNLRGLLDDFHLFSSGKTSLHCMAQCSGSIERAKIMCQEVFDGIKDFIASTGLEFDYS